MNALGQRFLYVFGDSVTNILGALVFLCVGWFIAFALSAVTKGLLNRTKLDNKLGEWIVGEKKAKTLKIEALISKGVYYVAMLFVLVGFFEALGLELIAQPLNHFLEEVTDYAPKILGASILFVAAWILAGIAKRMVVFSLDKLNFDGHVKTHGELEHAPVSVTVGELVYWIIFLIFLPGIIGALEIDGLLDPVQKMINKGLEYVPNIFAAALILAFGWFIARVVQKVSKNLSHAAGADGFAAKVGLDIMLGKNKFSDVLGTVAYVLMIIPVLVASLDALALEALTRPASNMLNEIALILPNMFAAILLMTVSLVVGRLVNEWVANLLSAIGFDNVLGQLGLGQHVPKGARTPSQIMGHMAFVAILLFSAMEAFAMIGLTVVSTILVEFVTFASQVALGLVILAIGIYFANLAAKLIIESGTPQAKMLSTFSRAAILVLAGFMSLSRMGLANDIINMAFGLLLGSLALAFGLAFGLGGRDFAAMVLDKRLADKV